MQNKPLKILFASSEVYPFIKTGGLADVSSGLPAALAKLGHDVRIILPAYKQTLDKYPDVSSKKHQIPDSRATLLQTTLPASKVPVWLVDIPELFYRNGGPYGAPSGEDWPDNAQRFDEFSKIACKIALNHCNLSWQPDVIHCNDWQTGLIPARLSKIANRPATLFTIHNMAYLGLFSHRSFEQLNLPEDWWQWNHLEFHNDFSFMKGGLVFADHINTVSPTYAEQIRTAEFGNGMEGLLNYRSHVLSGILNGVDYEHWNPALDDLIEQTYSEDSFADKLINKRALQNHFNLPVNDKPLLIGLIGRMVHQKGFDLLIDAIPFMQNNDIQIVVLGSGDADLEKRLLRAAGQYPDKVSVTIGYNEKLAHLIEAGADMFMMPSRFEPCGLNQFYSLKYGTLPFVSDTGGLADSVINCDHATLQNQTATGFKFEEFNIESFMKVFEQAIDLYQSPDKWQEVAITGMKKNYSWQVSAEKYILLYHNSIESQYHIQSNFSV